MTRDSFGEEPSPSVISSRPTASKPVRRDRSPSYRITQDEFIRATSPRDRETLREALNESVQFMLDSDRAVYLDGFGIVYPEYDTQIVSHSLSNTRAFVRKETRLTAGFEKCYDLVSFHREKYPGIAETKDIAGRIYPRLSLEHQVRWSERDTCRYLRGLIRSIRDEVIIDGISKQLGPVGDFFSLHNRQGDSPESWFAGADIYLKSNCTTLVAIEPGRTYELPVLTDSWELLTAAYGAPVFTFEVSLSEELEALGYTSEDMLQPVNESLKIGVFRSCCDDSGKHRLIYCTDGIRLFGSDIRGTTPGNEFVFQTPCSHAPVKQSDIPLWPARALVMGWLLLQSSKTKTVEYGAGLSSDAPVNCQTAPGMDDIDLPTGVMTAIFATPFELSRIPQRTESGCFRYINLVGITEDEGRVAGLYGSEHLHMLLKFRNYHQVTLPTRKSIVARTGLLPV